MDREVLTDLGGEAEEVKSPASPMRIHAVEAEFGALDLTELCFVERHIERPVTLSETWWSACRPSTRRVREGERR